MITLVHMAANPKYMTWALGRRGTSRSFILKSWGPRTLTQRVWNPNPFIEILNLLIEIPGSLREGEMTPLIGVYNPSYQGLQGHL